jgi:hypothetical protein
MRKSSEVGLHPERTNPKTKATLNGILNAEIKLNIIDSKNYRNPKKMQATLPVRKRCLQMENDLHP